MTAAAPNPRSRISRWALRALVLLTVASALGFVIYRRAQHYVFSESLMGHEHCISVAGLFLGRYADAHEGRFPYHPDGYPSALLLLENDSSWETLTGPGYSGDVLASAKTNGTRLTEADCGRVYIQGLKSKGNNQSMVILFDKIPTPGDHCHLPQRLWSPYVREVLWTDCSTSTILEADWPNFAREQVELLVATGYDRAEAERLYEVAPK